MRNEQDFFDALKSSPNFEPRQTFVQNTKENLLQKARKMEFKNKVKRISFVSGGIAVTAFFLVWISFFGGKQVIFDTVASIFHEDNDTEIIVDPPEEPIKMSENGSIAKLFLEEKGYEIVAYEGFGDRYILTLEKLVETPYMQQWWVQPLEADEFIGRTIETEVFIVQNHPLDELEGVETLGKTKVIVFLVNENAIGGMSLPVTVEQLYGGLYSLDGKTIEELYGIDYSTWQKSWMEKYRNDSSSIDTDTLETGLLEKTETIFSYLKTVNWLNLADYVHPEKGLFFSFYASAGSPYSDEVSLSKDEVRDLTGSETFIWGYDMAEYAFEFSVNDYVEKFLLGGSQRWDGGNTRELNYDVITFNDQAFHSGGIINTIPDYFPEAKYVEYYSPPPSDELSHQWQALRFIYEQHDGDWYLIGIARDVHSP
jgi:hypothetical protein